MIEYFVHLDPEEMPPDLALVRVTVPETVSQVKLAKLPKGWRASPPPAGLAEIGDSFVREHKAAVPRVPSAIVPQEENWLLNPAHPDSAQIQVAGVASFKYDARLFR
jgi:RES domain-containing protein